MSTYANECVIERSLLHDVALLRHINAIQEFPDILVAHTTRTLDGSSRLRNIFDVVTLEDYLILLRFGLRDRHAVQHLNVSDNLFAKEVPYFDGALVIGNNAVDWEMCVDRTHFVLEALRDSLDEIQNEALDGPQASDVLATALPDGQKNLRVLLAFDELDVHVDMPNILLERPSRARDRDQARLDGNGDAVGDDEFFGLQNVAHLCATSQSIGLSRNELAIQRQQRNGRFTRA